MDELIRLFFLSGWSGLEHETHVRIITACQSPGDIATAWLSQIDPTMRSREAHTGFEPVSPEVQLPEPLRRKLTELRLQSDVRSRRGKRVTGLNEKARDYEVLAASEVERAPLGRDG